jgi:hypothetical protein
MQFPAHEDQYGKALARLVKCGGQTAWCRCRKDEPEDEPTEAWSAGRADCQPYLDRLEVKPVVTG